MLKTIAARIDVPLLAVVPFVLFLTAYFLYRRRAALVAAWLWGLYIPYELAMRYRILCSGDCNIRVDLLLIYPILLVVSLIAAGATVRAIYTKHKTGAT